MVEQEEGMWVMCNISGGESDRQRAGRRRREGWVVLGATHGVVGLPRGREIGQV